MKTPMGRLTKWNRFTLPRMTVLVVLPEDPSISYQCIKLHSIENADSAT